jgi:methionyl-tRNA formyltransferase
VTPWPGAYTYLDGKLLKIFKVRTADGSGVPGTVIRAGREGMEIACSGGSLLIDELQLEGKKRLPAAEFVAGGRVQPGMVLQSKVNG